MLYITHNNDHKFNLLLQNKIAEKEIILSRSLTESEKKDLQQEEKDKFDTRERIELLQKKIKELISLNLSDSDDIEIMCPSNLQNVISLLEEVKGEGVLDSLKDKPKLRFIQIIKSIFSVGKIAVKNPILSLKISKIILTKDKNDADQFKCLIKDLIKEEMFNNDGVPSKDFISLLQDVIQNFPSLAEKFLGYCLFYNKLSDENKKVLRNNISQIFEIVKNPITEKNKKSLSKLVSTFSNLADNILLVKEHFKLIKKEFINAKVQCSNDVFQGEDIKNIIDILNKLESSLNSKSLYESLHDFLEFLFEEEKETKETRKGKFIDNLKTTFVADTNLKDFNKMPQIIRAIAKVMYCLGNEETMCLLDKKDEPSIAELIQGFEKSFNDMIKLSSFDSETKKILTKCYKKLNYIFMNQKDERVRKIINICLNCYFENINEQTRIYIFNNWQEILLNVRSTEQLFLLCNDKKVDLGSIRLKYRNNDNLLHEALYDWSFFDSVMLLLKNNPELIYVRNNDGKTPIEQFVLRNKKSEQGHEIEAIYDDDVRTKTMFILVLSVLQNSLKDDLKKLNHLREDMDLLELTNLQLYNLITKAVDFVDKNLPQDIKKGIILESVITSTGIDKSKLLEVTELLLYEKGIISNLSIVDTNSESGVVNNEVSDLTENNILENPPNGDDEITIGNNSIVLGVV